MSHNFKKQFGQNFLRSDRYPYKLVEALELQPEELVVEIGPGDGRVTNLLLQTGATVMSVEVDYDLLPSLIKRFGDNSKFELLHKDILAVTNEDLLKHTAAGKFKMAGSLPYNISKPIIYKFVMNDIKPQRMSFIVQEEVAQDYVALAPKATFLSNWIRLYTKVKKLETIPASQFFPVPKVNGAILVITPLELDAAALAEVQVTAKVVELGFRSPRKTLWNNLRAVTRWSDEQLNAAWTETKLQPTVRPAQLTLPEWTQLAKSLS